MRSSSKLQRLTPEGLSLVASRFRLLSEPLRLRILNRLQAGEISVSQLALEVGTSQPNMSKHLRLLIEGGLVARRPEKTSVFLRIADPLVIELCHLVCGSVETRLHRQAGAFVRKNR